MNHLKTVGIVIAVLVVLNVGTLLWGVYQHDQFVSNPPRGLGGTINYTNCLGQTNCYNMLASMLADIAALRSQFTGISATTTAAYGSGALGPTGSTTSTASTTFTMNGFFASTNDIVWLRPSTTTQNIVYSPVIVNSSTLWVGVQDIAGTAQTPATTTFVVWDVPTGFQAPAVLTTVTSTSN